jgi:hypothetical protein
VLDRAAEENLHDTLELAFCDQGDRIHADKALPCNTLRVNQRGLGGVQIKYANDCPLHGSLASLVLAEKQRNPPDLTAPEATANGILQPLQVRIEQQHIDRIGMQVHRNLGYQNVERDLQIHG